MRKVIIQKAVAGLGNRMQALGACLDLASEHDAQLFIDWRDLSWREGYDSCFVVEGAEPFTGPEQVNGATVWPGFYTPDMLRDFKRWDGPLTGDPRKEPQTLSDDIVAWLGGYDALVYTRYSAKYTDRLFECVRFSDAVIRRARWTMLSHGLTPGEYDALHIRHTDKRGIDPAQAIADRPSLGVICTDSVEVKSHCIQRGKCCPSVIPTIPGGRVRRGAHHSTDSTLAACRMDRAMVNMSTVVDLIICGLAREFATSCDDSSYAMLIERGRTAKWFNQAL